jgi:predicted flap endonuclease-1-like 5' DNA nuclease
MLGGIAAGVAGGLVALAWLLKDRLSGPAPETVGADEAPRFRVAPPPPAPSAPAAPEKSAEPDDLSEIKGIGPAYRSRLEKAGVTTFAALGASDATELAEKIEAPVSRVQAWIDAARRRT